MQLVLRTTVELRTLDYEDLTVSVRCEPDNDVLPEHQLPVSLARQVRADLEGGNQWAWCQVTVSAEFEGMVAHRYLGGCNYASEDDFRKGDYYTSMLAECLDELQERAEGLCRYMLDLEPMR